MNKIFKIRPINNDVVIIPPVRGSGPEKDQVQKVVEKSGFNITTLLRIWFGLQPAKRGRPRKVKKAL